MSTPKQARFNQPAVNDDDGNCVSCGRDNRGHDGEPCHPDCPMYWEDVGIQNGDYA